MAQPAAHPSFSAVIPASRPEALARCLGSLEAAAPRQGFECLVIVNGRDQEVDAVLSSFSGRVPGLRRLTSSPPRSPGSARNAALAEARGDWLCFLDDDVQAPAGYFAALTRAAERHPAAAAIGGPNLTPPGRPLFERCCGHVLASPLCAGPMSRRYRAGGRESPCDERSLILCNLAVRRSALVESGLRFDDRLLRNEENLLLDRLQEGGARLIFCPELAVVHERRPTPASFARQCYLSGRGRAEMTGPRPGSVTPLHAAPAALVAAVALLPLWPSALAPAVAAYAAAAAFHAAWLCRRSGEGPRAFGWLLVLAPAAQASYGAGLIAGLLRPAAAFRRP
jgi:GT2 family glycosyltransferase